MRRATRTLERLWERPTLEVNGVAGGGKYTVIPHVAVAHVSCRLVPGQDPAAVIEAIAAHVRARWPRQACGRGAARRGPGARVHDPGGPSGDPGRDRRARGGLPGPAGAAGLHRRHAPGRPTCSSGCSGRRRCSSRSPPPTRTCTHPTSSCASAGCARGCGPGSTCGGCSPPGRIVSASFLPVKVSRKMADPLEAAPAPGAAAARAEAAARLARLGEEFFEAVHATDPFNATQLGVPGFDALVPDPSRAARRAGRRGSRRSSGGWATSTAGLLGESDRTNHAVLGPPRLGRPRRPGARPLGGQRVGGGYVSPQAMVVPVGPGRAARRRRRGGRLPAAAPRAARLLRRRHRPLPAGQRATAGSRPRSACGRPSTSSTGHLGKDIAADTLVSRVPCRPRRATRRGPRARPPASSLTSVRPAMRRLLACLRDELLPAARPDEPGRHPVRPRRRGGLPGRGAAAHHHRADRRADPPDRPGRAGRPAGRVGRAGRPGAGHQRRARRSWPGCGTTARCGSATPRRSCATVTDALRARRGGPQRLVPGRTTSPTA